MVVLDTDNKLDVDDLPPELTDAASAYGSGEMALESAHARGSDGAAGIGATQELIGKPMDDIERWAIEETLKMTAGNREEAAKILNIGARTLYRKLDKYRQDSPVQE
jgi:two-component system response regulator HydG